MTLTDPQQSLLRFLSYYQAAWGWAPSRREICAAMGWKSTNAAQDALLILERKGRIRLGFGARAICLVGS